MEKITIKNRKGLKIVVLIEKAQDPKGLAIVMHGLGGSKEQPHIVAIAEAFKDKNYTVVKFDTTNAFGESDGKYEDATITTYYEDLEDVISWVKTQPWYMEPFVLAGHSLGSISIILYAEKHPEELKGLAPTSTVVSGKLSIESPMYLEKMDQWKKTGWKIEMSTAFPGRIKKLPYSHMIDRLKYDVLPEADKLTMPVLLIVGDHDEGTPYEHQKMLYDKLPAKKELHVIKGSAHTFKGEAHLTEIKQIFHKWIDTLQ